MFICICHGITDAAISNSVAQGTTTMRSLCHCLNVGSDCGQCVKSVKRVLDSKLIQITDAYELKSA
ncbi:MAG: bacterioferritin-associated ferredoxin [Phenylobacterium sp.]|jgi:bacterioferritin-associated ferredoxin